MSDEELPTRRMRVEPVKVAEFVQALGVLPEEGWEAVVGAPVPPGYLTYAASYDPSVIHERLGLDPFGTLYASLELEILETPLIGDVLDVTPRLGAPREVLGSSGPLRLIPVDVDYVRDGRVIMHERSTVAGRSPAHA